MRGVALARWLGFVLLGGTVVFAPVNAGAQAECDRSPILVQSARLWTPTGSAGVSDVLFEDGRVASIAPGGTTSPSAQVRVIDGKGQTLLPGLIDLHLHFGVPGGLPQDGSSPPARNWQISGRQLLRSGVTSGRSHMTSPQGAALIRKDGANPCSPLPRVEFSGPEMAGGQPDAETPNFIGVRNAQDAAEKVQRAAEAGFKWISLYDAGKFGPGELPALIATARSTGIRIMGPIGSAHEMTALITAGVDTIDDIDTTPAKHYPRELLDGLKTLPDVTLVPTIGYAFRIEAFDRDPSLIDAPSNYEFMTPAEKAFVGLTAKEALKKDGYVVNSRRIRATLETKFRELLATRAPMATGTDAGSADHFHSGAIWWELEAWRSFGAQPREALVAATATAARVLRDPRAGSLQVGSRADFVLYAGDAEKGRFTLERVRAVARDGILFVRDGAWIGDVVY